MLFSGFYRTHSCWRFDTNVLPNTTGAIPVVLPFLEFWIGFGHQ